MSNQIENINSTWSCVKNGHRTKGLRTSGVNFIHNLQAAILSENFLHLQLMFAFYLAKGNKQRAAHKMLVKLTAMPVLNAQKSIKYGWDCKRN